MQSQTENRVRRETRVVDECAVSSWNVKESKFEIVSTTGQTSVNSDCGPSRELAEGEKRGCILFPVKITFFFFF